MSKTYAARYVVVETNVSKYHGFFGYLIAGVRKDRKCHSYFMPGVRKNRKYHGDLIRGVSHAVNKGDQLRA